MKTIIPIIVAMALALASCQSGNTRNGEKYGGTLRVNISDIPHIIFPGQVEKRSEQIIVSQVYDGLLKYNPKTLDIVPSLAKSIELSDDSLAYTFLLNTQARFQDDSCFANGIGRTIIANDIKYSIEQICRNRLADSLPISSQVGNIAGYNDFLLDNSLGITGISAKNDSVIIVRLDKPDSRLLQFLAGTDALVFAREAFDAYGTNGTVGSGAFRLDKPEYKGQPVTLAYNPNYWKMSRQKEQLPYLDSLIFTFATSAQKELNMFSSGKTNVVFDLPADYLTDFMESNIESFQCNPPLFMLTNTVNSDNDKRFNLQTADIQGLNINSQNCFDFSEVYFKAPEPHTIVVNQE